MSTTEDIARLNAQIQEIKEYLNRIEDRIEVVYTDMGRIRENMAIRDDIDRLRETMATSRDVDKLWKFFWIFLTAIVGLSITLIIFLLTKQAQP